MNYRTDKNGVELSILGFGCMRFPKKGNAIDLAETEKEILRAVELGVNYFDTAYIYPGSEAALGEIVSRNHIRDRIHIATKLPQYMIGSRAAIDKYFHEQLSRLKTDYVDYYLMHMLTDIEAWNKLKKHGIEDWLRQKKESGAIRQIGFSFHGNTEMFLKILDAYDWDFCQVQYNYMDEVSQAGRRGVEEAGKRGIPVIIMEPLRGGKLTAMLPPKAKEAIRREGHGQTPAQLAFRWLWDQPDVTVVLSGMNSMEMLEENCATASASEVGGMTTQEHQLLDRVKGYISERLMVGCTGCGYCMPCPKGVDIPGTFSCYNTMYMEGKNNGRMEYMRTVALRKKPAFPSQCVGCGRCERHCPQHISIIEELKKANRALLPIHFRIMMEVGRRFVLRGSDK